ncbi:MAG: HAMP domain-containing protein, partial [Gaiellales bacterium]
MLRSLRTRLALLFAGTLLLATTIAGAASIRLYQSYNRDQVRNELLGQIEGVREYYQRALDSMFLHSKSPPTPVTAHQMQKIAGSRFYYISDTNAFPVPGVHPSLQSIHAPLDWKNLNPKDRVTFHFTPPGETGEFVGAAAPLVLRGQSIGAVVLAKRLADVNNAWRHVAARVAIGTGLGLLVAFILATLVARRITRPLRVLGGAADRVARGDLEVDVVGKKPSDDELGQLATRFQGMVDRLREVDELERNFLMRVTHELRTPVTAISGHVQALTDGLVGPED